MNFLHTTNTKTNQTHPPTSYPQSFFNCVTNSPNKSRTFPSFFWASNIFWQAYKTVA